MNPLIRRGSKQLIRDINRTIVVNAVRSAGEISRAEIAKATGLGPPTVSGITNELIAAGVLVELDPVADPAGAPTAPVGRRPVMVALEPSAGYAMGAKLTERAVIGVLTDLTGAVVARNDVAFIPGNPSVDDVVSAVADCFDGLLPATGGRTLHGVGVGLAGVIDRRAGVVRHATYASDDARSSWTGATLADRLAERLGHTVVIDNDVNALTAAELWFGAGRGVEDFVTVSIGRGIGLGLVLGGRLHRGWRGGAGEFGHVKVEGSTARCPCGARGCLEAVAGEPAIAAAVGERLGRTLSIDETVALAADGDPHAIAAYAAAGRMLGTAIGNVLNLVDPQLVIVSGEGTRGIEWMLDAVHEGIDTARFNGIGERTVVTVEPWDDEAWARGAASIVLGELFEPPLRPDDGRRPSLTPR